MLLATALLIAASLGAAPAVVGAADDTDPGPAPAATPGPDSVSAAPVTPTDAPAVEPAPAQSPSPPEPTAARDLWLHEGTTVTRVDHLSGEVLGRWDVAHPDCPASHGGRPYVDGDGGSAWTLVVDAEWDSPVLECVIGLPLDGSTAPEVYPVPTGRKPTFVHAAAAQGEDLWAIVWKKKGAGATLSYYDDWSLARLDRWAGSLVQVLPRVVALAPSAEGLVVLYSERGGKQGARRPQRLGIVEPGGGTPRELPVGVVLPRTKKGTYVTPRLRLAAGLEGSVALYDEFADRDVLVFDPASGAVIGQVAPPRGATAVGPVWPVSGGVWMSGLLRSMDDFVRFAPFDGGPSIGIDPCAGVAGGCYTSVETASDAGAWIGAWPFDKAFEVDLDRVVLRRYDADGQVLIEVAGSELFGTE